MRAASWSVRLVAVAVAALLVAPLAGASDKAYVAQSLWSAKHTAGVDAAWMKARPVWIEKPEGRDVVVGILATGFDPTHPDLADVPVRFKDFSGDATGRMRTEPYDDQGYGTFLAGLVAGRGHFQWNPLRPYWLVGARGVAPEAELLVAKAIRADGASHDAELALALRWLVDPDGDPATDDGADVVVVPTALERPRLAPSLATPLALGGATKDVAQKALARGVVLVVAAGDQSDARPLPPGDLPGAIVVGAVDRAGARADFVSKGPSLDVLAPGVLVGPWPGALDTLDFAEDGYSSVAGTGVAAAFTAGVVALLLEGDPELAAPTELEALGLRKVAAVEKALKDHAVPLGGKPAEEGAGLLATEPALRAVDRGGDDLDWRVVGTLGTLGALVVLLFARNVWTKAKERAHRPREPAG